MAEQEPLPPPPKRNGGILTFGRASQPQQDQQDYNGITSDVNSLSRRLKLLEEGFTNTRRFLQVTEESMITRNKHYSAEIKTVSSDISEIRKEIQDLRDKFLLVVRELQTVARKEEVRILEKYINLWNPIRFVTQNEVDQIINEILDKRKLAEKE